MQEEADIILSVDNFLNNGPETGYYTELVFTFKAAPEFSRLHLFEIHFELFFDSVFESVAYLEIIYVRHGIINSNEIKLSSVRHTFTNLNFLNPVEHFIHSLFFSESFRPNHGDYFIFRMHLLDESDQNNSIFLSPNFSWGIDSIIIACYE